MNSYATVLNTLLTPAKVYSRKEVLTRPSPVPNKPGIYAWYFNDFLGDAVEQNYHCQQGLYLLYVGISPSQPPNSGKPPSSQTLRKRIRNHFNGNAAGSTLRLSLGCLLSAHLGLQLRRVASGRKMTFTYEGEQTLNRWLDENAFVIWAETPEPWVIEPVIIQSQSLPLNLEHNRGHHFYSQLSQARYNARQKARELSVIVR